MIPSRSGNTEVLRGPKWSYELADREIHSAGAHPLLKGLLVTAAGFCSPTQGLGVDPAKSSGTALLLYCVKGAGWFELDGRLQPLRKGDLLFVRPGRPCGLGTWASEPWSVFLLELTGALLAEYARELEVVERFRVLHRGADPRLHRLFSETLSCLRSGSGTREWLLACHAVAHLLAILVANRKAVGGHDGDTARKVAEAIIYMSEHLEETVRVPELARMAGLSPAYFTALFKAQAGCAPREYLHLLRMHRACELLHQRTLSVKEIATRIGYQDPFHFSRQFKLFQGVPPSQYRDHPRP